MTAARRVGLGVAACLALCGSTSTAADGVAAKVEVVQTTADLSQHLTRLADLQFGAAALHGMPVIRVDDSARYQRIGGFGAAMTDSSAWLIERRLPASARNRLMSRLFGARGLALDFLRVPMGASDFTKNGRPYTYDDRPPGSSDLALAHFSVRHDRRYILPALRQAVTINPGLTILANPWSAPAWMKRNGSLDNIGHRGALRASAAKSWAQYFVKFIEAYARAGVPVAALTPQNEPHTGSHYPGMEMPERAEARWIVGELQPALQAAGLHPRIYGNDQGWGGIALPYAKALASGPAAGALAGIAWHCYFGGPNVMSAARRAARKLDQILDECSPGITPFPTSETVIASVRSWASTVALWNLALDPQGGPVEPPDSGCPTCTGLVTIDERTHAITRSLDYFQLGQASAFVQAGAQRLGSRHFVRYDYKRPGVNIVTPGLDDVAFLNPDGGHVLVAYDNSQNAITFGVRWSGQSFSYTLPARATVTFVWR